MKKLTVVGAIAAGALLTGCGASAPPNAEESVSDGPAAESSTFTVSGELRLADVQSTRKDGDPCSGAGGYADIRGGAQVKISDSAGSIVGLGELEAGRAEDVISQNDGTEDCVFAFTVSDISESGNIYGVEVSHRGIVQFPRQEADSVVVTLGDYKFDL